MAWSYNAKDYEERSFALIPVGRYRCRIEDAEEQVSKNTQLPMIKLTIKVSGYNGNIWPYILLDDRSEEAVKRTNQFLGAIFDSFAIPAGNMNLAQWKGKTGGLQVRHGKDNNGNDRAEVQYFLRRKFVDELPAWQENLSSASTPSNDFSPENIENVPF